MQNDKLEHEIRSLSIPVKGTMKMHQVRWSSVSPEVLDFNTLSCFDCCNAVCEHYALQTVQFVSPQFDESLIESALNTRTKPSLDISTALIKPDNEIIISSYQANVTQTFEVSS